MKKMLMAIVTILAVAMLFGSASAYTVNFDLGGDMVFSELTGLQFDVSGDYLAAMTGTPGSSMPVVAPGSYPWFIGKSSNGFFSYDVSSLGQLTVVSPLSAGTVLIVTGDSPFSLSNFVFGSGVNTDGSGEYPYTVFVCENLWTDGLGATYTASLTECSAVPIPGAVWLLGSGLLGLVTIRRHRG